MQIFITEHILTDQIHLGKGFWIQLCINLRTYHYVQFADDTVGLDHPVDRLLTSEEQHNITVQRVYWFQWPQIDRHIHLQGTAQRDRARGKKRLRKCNRKMSSACVSGQLIKTLAIFPEKAGHMRNTPLDAILLVNRCNVSHSFLSHCCVIRALGAENHLVQ